MDVEKLPAIVDGATLYSGLRKIQAKLIWMRSWVGRCGQYGLNRLQQEMEVSVIKRLSQEPFLNNTPTCLISTD